MKMYLSSVAVKSRKRQCATTPLFWSNSTNSLFNKLKLPLPVFSRPRERRAKRGNGVSYPPIFLKIDINIVILHFTQSIFYQYT